MEGRAMKLLIEAIFAAPIILALILGALAITP